MSVLTAADRVQETAQSVGASTAITLLGAAALGLRTFAAAGLDGELVPYVIEHTTSGQWEVGEGEYVQSGAILNRTMVYSNSAGTTVPLDFALGLVEVWVDLPAEKAVMLDADSAHLTLPAGLTIAGQLDGVTVLDVATLTVATSLAPATDNAVPLGTASKRWSDFRSVTATLSGLLSGAAATFTGLLTAAAGATISAAQTLALAGALISGAPSWGSAQAITLSTAAQPAITSVGTLSSLTMGGTIGAQAITPNTDNLYALGTSSFRWSDVRALTATFTNTITASISGSSGSTTGNAATATALQTGRTINGVTFDGTSNITVTAAANTLTTTTLNATVVNSSLQTLGTVSAGVWAAQAVNPATDNLSTLGTASKRWSDLQAVTGTFGGAVVMSSTLNVTGTITGSISGNAATATALQNARTINGVSFDGTGNITVTAAANTLTTTTLNATVVNSSLQTLGTVTVGSWAAGAVNPAVDNSSTLGTASKRWSDLQTMTGTFSTSITGPLATAVQPNITTMAALVSVGTITTGAWNAGAVTVAGDVTINGHQLVLASTAGTNIPSGNAQAFLGTTTINGLQLVGKGSTYDFVLFNGAGTQVCSVPTGTTNIAFANGITVGGSLTPLTDNASALGTASKRWSDVQAMTATFGGAAFGGNAVSSAILINADAAAVLTQTSSYGMVLSPTFGSGVTAGGSSLLIGMVTQAASFTSGSVCGIQIETPIFGAGSTVTTAYGLFVNGISGAGTNYAIRTGSGLVLFGDAVTMNSTLGVAGAATFGLVTVNAGLTVSSGQTLTLTGATITGAPTWSSNQAITLSTAAQPNVTSLGTLAANLIFTDNLYDIGASGATRPRNYFGSGTGTFGGALSIGGKLSVTSAQSSDYIAMLHNTATGASANGLVIQADTSDTAAVAFGVGNALNNWFRVFGDGHITVNGALVNASTIAASNLSGTNTGDQTTFAASALTGTTMAAVVTASSLTSFGTLAANLLFVDNAYDIGAGGSTNRPRNYFGSGTGLFRGHVYIGGTGSVPTANILTIDSSAVQNGSTFMQGALFQPTFGSAVTGGGVAVYAQGVSAAASFTMAALTAILIDSPIIGAGSTITTAFGMQINDITGAATNYAIKTGLGLVSFGDKVTASSGVTFGTGAGVTVNGIVAHSSIGLQINGSGSTFDIVLQGSGGIAAVVPAGTTNFQLSNVGDLILGRAYVATPQIGTGYIILKDNTGTSYKFLVST